MKLRAEAKLNLTLEVGARRADGYHDVDTVMHSISLCDVVTLGVLDSIEVTCAGLDCDAQDNIAYKAARAFFARAGLSGGVRIDIAKGIPVGAGLGGGSADAAAVLRGLNALYGRPLDASALLELAAGVGADVPFCLLGGAARCRGIGERVEPLPSAGGVHAVVVYDGTAAFTAEMYRRLDAFVGAKPPHDHESAARAVAAGDPRALAGALSNDFDALAPSPLTAPLYERGALRAMLTGSGSAVFGVFADAASASACAAALSAVYPFAAHVVFTEQENDGL